MDDIKGLKILHLNVRSFLRKKDELYLTFKTYDILCFSETWLNQNIPDGMLFWPGFTLWRLDRNSCPQTIKKGGGLLVYVKDKYSKYVEKLEQCTLCNKDMEILTFVMQYPFMRKLQLSVIYRPPKGSLSNFMDCIKRTIIDVNLLKTDVVLLGDYNINYNQRNSRGYRLLKSFERDTGLKQLINSDNRTCPKFSSRIDLILSNIKDISTVSVLDDLISDHFPIFMVKKHKKVHAETEWTTGRLYKRYDENIFKLNLNSHDWADYYTEVDPELLWREMKEKIEK